MKKKRRAFLVSLGVLFFMFAPVQLIHAANTELSSYDEENTYTDYDDVLDDDYYIEKYHVDINVKKNNTFHITETLTYNFVQPHHGMTREIPLTHTREREDGSESVIKATVSHFKCSDRIAHKETDDEDYIVNIGNANKEITGEKTYTISYDYVMGADPLEGADELYFNIVGTEWDCPINNITWTIHMPKDFDTSTIGYSVGHFGMSGYDEDLLTSEVKDNTITGSYKDYLSYGEGITIRAVLPEGYFVYQLEPAYIFLIIIVLASFIYFIITGKDKRIIPVISFEPPEGYHALDVLYVMNDGRINNDDFCVMLIELADQGYISIKKNSDTSFTIKKEKDYDGDDPVALNYILELFNGKSSITNNALAKTKFYEKVEDCIEKEKQKMEKRNIFYNFKISQIIYLVGFFLVCIEAAVLDHSVYTGVTAGIIGIMFAIGLDSLQYREGRFISLIVFLAALIVGAIYLNFFLTYPVLYKVMACCIAIAILDIFYTYGAKKTPEGNKIYSQILGFKKFIKRAEVDQLEMLVEENPNYYYHILPYAYAFGLSDKWIANFEKMNVEIPEPDWYTGRDAFNTRYFYKNFNSAMDTASTKPTSSSSSSRSSSGGGYSGGGFSGGGSGGGGGGAW